MFLGYTLAVLSILGTAKVAVALLVLGVPIIDAFWIIVRRLANRPLAVHPRPRPPPSPAARPRPVATARRSLLIYAICVRLGALSFLLSGAGQVYAFLGVVVGSGSSCSC